MNPRGCQHHRVNQRERGTSFMHGPEKPIGDAIVRTARKCPKPDDARPYTHTDLSPLCRYVAGNIRERGGASPCEVGVATHDAGQMSGHGERSDPWGPRPGGLGGTPPIDGAAGVSFSLPLCSFGSHEGVPAVLPNATNPRAQGPRVCLPLFLRSHSGSVGTCSVYGDMLPSQPGVNPSIFTTARDYAHGTFGQRMA